MLGRKSSSPKTRPLNQFLEVKLNWNEACQSLNSTGERGAKYTQNPESSLVLHSCQKQHLSLGRSSSKEPEFKTISCNCQVRFTPGWKSAEWTRRWVDLWNDLGFSLCAAPSVCRMVATSDEGEKVWVEVSAEWCVAAPEIEFNKRLSLSIIRLANYSVTTSLIYKWKV